MRRTSVKRNDKTTTLVISNPDSNGDNSVNAPVLSVHCGDSFDQIDSQAADLSMLAEIIGHMQVIVFRLKLVPLMQFEYVSPQVEKFSGYTADDLYKAPELLRETVDPKDREILEMLLTVPCNIPKDGVDVRWIHKNGSVNWLHIVITPLFNGKGEVIAIDGVARDITGAKSSEVTLMENERRLLQIVDVNSIPTFIIDRNHTITYWNKALERATGLRSEEMIGTKKHWKAFYNTERPILADLVLDQASYDVFNRLYGDKYHVSTRYSGAIEVTDYFPDFGRLGKWFFFTAVPLVDENNKIIGAVETLQDITDQKLAERALKEQLIFLQTLIDTIPHPIFYKDAGGAYLGCNKAFGELFDISQNDVFGKKVDEILPKEIAAINHTVDEYLILNPGVKSYETSIRLKDGTQKHFLLNKATFMRDDGTLAGVVGVMIDMTDHRQLEDKLRQAQKMEAIGTLAAGIAHDFNNILASVMMNAELVLLDSSGTQNNREELEQILKSSYRAKDLVNQILTFSRQNVEEKKPVNMTPLVKESLKMIQASLPSTIEIRHSIAADQCFINGSPVQIQQVIVNLCNNSAFAMKKHGGILEIAVSPLTIGGGSDKHLAGLDPGEYVNLSVRDTGEGIDDTIAEQVFDPFFTTKTAGQGSGLGLSVVHGIVRNHNGVITFSSKPGEGTVFDVYFPRIQPDEFDDETEQSSPVSGSESILIIDDELELVNVMKKVLIELNYSVVTKTSSVEALVYFRNHYDSLDLVVTDLTMPRITGTELAERMKNIRPNIPILLCTGYNEGIALDEVQRHGIDAILKKPFSRSEFANKIRGMLTRKADGQ